MRALEYLLGAYFHQDFDIDGGEASDTVAAFLRSEQRPLAEALAKDIDDFLELSFAEGELSTQLTAWGCQYFAGEIDADYRAWLSDVRDQIYAFLHNGRPTPTDSGAGSPT